MNSSDLDYLPDRLDSTYIEIAGFALFKINLIEHIKLRAILAKQYHIQPSEIDKMSYWEFELFIKYLNDAAQEENNRQQAEMDKYNVNEYMNMARPGNISKMTQAAVPKMPDMNLGKMPTSINVGGLK